MQRVGGTFKNWAGFERVELLVAFCIAATLFFLVVPAFIRGRTAVQEEKMKAALRLFHSANEAYRITSNHGYAASVGALTDASKGRRYLEPWWGTLAQYGYRLAYKTDRTAIPAHFSLVAERKTAFATDSATLCVDERGLVFRDSHPARAGAESGAACSGGIVVV